jgi:hypothetical protein
MNDLLHFHVFIHVIEGTGTSSFSAPSSSGRPSMLLFNVVQVYTTNPSVAKLANRTFSFASNPNSISYFYVHNPPVDTAASWLSLHPVPLSLPLCHVLSIATNALVTQLLTDLYQLIMAVAAWRLLAGMGERLILPDDRSIQDSILNRQPEASIALSNSTDIIAFCYIVA